jgi:hypothetical protein
MSMELKDVNVTSYKFVGLRTELEDGSCVRGSRGHLAMASEDEPGERSYTWEM